MSTGPNRVHNSALSPFISPWESDLNLAASLFLDLSDGDNYSVVRIRGVNTYKGVRTESGMESTHRSVCYSFFFF